MVIVHLFGPDSYRRTEKVKELIAAYRAKYRYADFLAVDFEDDPEAWVRARDFLRQPSMFVDSKVLLVREPAMVEEKEWRAALEEAAKAKDVVAILSAYGDSAEAFPFLARGEVTRQEFKELDGRMLEVFVVREAKRRGITFEAPALRYFLAYLASSASRSARAVSELERIALAGFRSPITRADMERFVAWIPAEDIYRGLAPVRAGRNPGERLAALERVLGRYDGARLFNTLAYAARGEVAEALAAYDIAIKSGRLEYEEALTDFAMSASGAPAVTRAETFVRDAI